MGARLSVTAGPDEGRSFELEPGQPLRVGRGQISQTRLTDATVSRVHCEVSFDGHVAILTNLSAVGTRVNGKLVDRQPLRPGDVLTIGATRLVFEMISSQDAPTIAAEDPPSDDESLPHLIGRTLGHYRLASVIGEGGMAVVFRAEDIIAKRFVALKVLKPRPDPANRERFLREARAVSTLQHPHIVRLFEVGQQGEMLYLATELLVGETLEQRLQRGRLSPTEALAVARETALGLGAAHGLGLVHRDIKPANLWLERLDRRTGPQPPPVAEQPTLTLGLSLPLDWQVKILDFGLVWSRAEPRLTAKGFVAGTLGYLSPEQARGEELDGRSDFFSLGCVLYRACTGQLPFVGDSPASAVRELLRSEPKPIHLMVPSIPPSLEALVMRLLQKVVDRRPASAKELLELIEVARQEAIGPTRS